MAVRMVTEEGNALLTFERGGQCLARGCRLQKCAMCEHHTEMLWLANSETHRIRNGSDEPVSDRAVCSHCWGKWLIEDESPVPAGLLHNLTSTGI